MRDVNDLRQALDTASADVRIQVPPADVVRRVRQVRLRRYGVAGGSVHGPALTLAMGLGSGLAGTDAAPITRLDEPEPPSSSTGTIIAARATTPALATPYRRSRTWRTRRTTVCGDT